MMFLSEFKQAIEMDLVNIISNCLEAKTERAKKEFKEWRVDG